METDQRKEFIKYLVAEYRRYSSTVYDNILNIFDSLENDSEKTYFIETIKEHQNQAFACRRDLIDEVKAKTICDKLTPTGFEVLCQLIEGPKFDGDVVSKNGKYELYRLDLALRICNNGEYGDNAANHMGWLVYKEYKKRIEEK